MTAPGSKPADAQSPEHQFLETQLRTALPAGTVADAANLARTAAETARAMAARLPLEQRDVSGFLETLEFLAHQD
jgi:hypothetical protein